jgi:hypothetical protein
VCPYRERGQQGRRRFRRDRMNGTDSDSTHRSPLERETGGMYNGVA